MGPHMPQNGMWWSTVDLKISIVHGRYAPSQAYIDPSQDDKGHFPDDDDFRPTEASSVHSKNRYEKMRIVRGVYLAIGGAAAAPAPLVAHFVKTSINY